LHAGLAAMVVAIAARIVVRRMSKCVRCSYAPHGQSCSCIWHHVYGVGKAGYRIIARLFPPEA
jgi:hypothetical protein